MANERIAIVTVHGTGDTAAALEGEKWFQRGSKFIGRLKARLAHHGVEANIVPHLWSGANSANAREKAAEALAKTIRRIAKTHKGVHVIGHSHGGNVANDAACLLGWSRKQHRPRLTGVTTVGTPFFRSRVTWTERLSAWIFLLLVAVVVPSVAYFTVTGLQMERHILDDHRSLVQGFEQEERAWVQEMHALQSMDRQPTREQAARLAELQNTLAFMRTFLPEQQQDLRAAENAYRDATFNRSVIALGSFIAFAIIVPLALQGVRRVHRRGRRARSQPEIQSIWHPNDEAIAFLQRVEKLHLEPFPRWSLLRASRTGAVVWGVRLAVGLPILSFLLFLIVYVMVIYLKVGVGFFNHHVEFGPFLGVGYGGGIGALPLAVAFGAVFGAPLVFIIVYVLYRLGAMLVLELGLRDSLNRSIGGTMQGMAFGRDNDARIGDVSSCSHHYGTTRVVLDGDVAQRMLTASTEATARLLDKYRGGLFAVDVEEGNAVTEMAQDAMTWESLIHTTYFDQQEIADAIGDHIADRTTETAAAI